MFVTFLVDFYQRSWIVFEFLIAAYPVCIIRVSNSLKPGSCFTFVRPDLGSNCVVCRIHWQINSLFKGTFYIYR